MLPKMARRGRRGTSIAMRRESAEMVQTEAQAKRDVVRSLIQVDRKSLWRLFKVFYPLCGTIIVLLPVSASIFQAVEGGHEDEAEDLYRATLPLANRVLCANVEATLSTMLTEEQCAAIIQHVDTYTGQLDGFDTAISEGQKDWDFWNSCIFVTSIISTVGWGNLSPKTLTGKWLTIILCFIGVPITLALFASLALILKRVAHFVTARIEMEFMWRFHQGFVWLYGHEHDTTRARSWFHPDHFEALLERFDSINHVPAVVFSMLFTLAYIAALGVWYKSDEFDLDDDPGTSHEGKYLTGVYYAIITFTTVGFGDFNIGKDSRHDGGVVCGFIVSVFVGVSLVSMTFAVIQHAVSVLGFNLEVVDGDDDRLIHNAASFDGAQRFSARSFVTSPNREHVERIVRKGPDVDNDQILTHRHDSQTVVVNDAQMEGGLSEQTAGADESAVDVVVNRRSSGAHIVSVV